MRGNCILKSGLLLVTLSLAIAKHKQSHFAKSCYPRGTLSRAVDMLYVKVAWLKATIPEDHIKNIRLLKKKSKKLFMKNCRFQEQLLSFFMEDVFGQLQLQVCKEIHFVEEFHSLRQKLSRCVITIPTKRVFTTSRLEGEENNPLKRSISGEMETYGSDCRLEWSHSKEQASCFHFNIWKQKYSSAFNIPSIPLFARDLDSSALAIRFMISCASSAREMKSITRIKRIFYEIGNRGIYKAITELDILLSWIKQFLESIK